MATWFPWDTIVEILSRLPVKDLLRYRAVCKQWCSLIDGPDFINLHLNRSNETSIVLIGRQELYWGNLEALCPPERLRSPVDTRAGINVVGVCNGLVAVSNFNGKAAIWNPSTRRHVVLPDLVYTPHIPACLDSSNISLLGFGYDQLNSDYKLVYCYVGERGSSQGRVYSLKRKAWKRITFPNHLMYKLSRNGVLVHSALHWIVMRLSDCSQSVLAFDIGTEEFREFPMPDYADEKSFESFCVGMVNLGHRVCVSVVDLQSSGRVDIWVMEEYGVRESWTKFISLGTLGPDAFFSSAIPIAYQPGLGGDGDTVLMNCGGQRFAVYNIIKRKIMRFFHMFTEPIFCKSSLVDVGFDGGESTKTNGGIRPVTRRGCCIEKLFRDFEP